VPVRPAFTLSVRFARLSRAFGAVAGFYVCLIKKEAGGQCKQLRKNCSGIVRLYELGSTTCSMDVFDLRILRLALEPRSGRPLQVYVEESADVVRRHSNLAAAIKAHDA
jgi:hypothetical protein